MPLSYPGGELPKQTIPLYLIDQIEVLCPLLDHLLAKGRHFHERLGPYLWGDTLLLE